MRRDRERSSRGAVPVSVDDLRRLFDRDGVVAAYLFGSTATGTPHTLSDIDLAYVGTNADVEDRLFDELYEALQRALGEGGFDLVPLRRAPLYLRFEVTTDGRLLLSRDAAARESFEARSIVHWLDFKRHRDEYFAAGSDPW